MTAPAMPTPTPIEPPANFPVEWQDPIEPMLLWEREQLHFPYPYSPLASDFMPENIARGITTSLRSMGAPVVEVRNRRINTYLYMATIPDLTKLEGAEARMRQAVAERGFTMYQRWNDEYLPEVEAISQRFIDFDYANATDAELAACIDDVLVAAERAFDIHFALLPGFQLAPAFKDACNRLLGYQGLEAYEMMQGAPNLSVESGSKLWQLAQSAPPAVRDVINGNPSADALARLRAMPEAAAFLAGFDEYVRVYGWRTGSFDFFQPSWVERPEFALDNVRLMFRVERDPAEDQAEGARRAEAAAAAAREKLADNPAARGEFVFLLDRAREYPQLQENHNFYLDQKFLAVARLPFAEAGRRLAAAGVIPAAEDFPYLRLQELQAAIRGDHTPRHAEVAERRAEIEYWAKVVPPVALGSRPPAGITDMFRSDFFGQSIIEPSPEERVLKGTPSSRGTATGTARVIRALSEIDRVEDGDILICEMTTPAWTPVFASLAGIVSDSGGPLSHCAVVAREYGVPCITGTRIATATIPDGATVTIDGTAGTVRVH